MMARIRIHDFCSKRCFLKQAGAATKTCSSLAGDTPEFTLMTDDGSYFYGAMGPRYFSGFKKWVSLTHWGLVSSPYKKRSYYYFTPFCTLPSGFSNMAGTGKWALPLSRCISS